VSAAEGACTLRRDRFELPVFEDVDDHDHGGARYDACDEGHETG